MRVTAAKFLIVGGVVTGCVGSAGADELFGFVQITCVPEISYFAIRRFEVYNLPHGGPFLSEGRHAGRAQLETLKQKYGIHTSSGLKEHPFECSIPSINPISGMEPLKTVGFSVRVVGHLDTNSQESSYRNIVDDAEVFLNGRSIARMGLNPYGFTVGTNSVQITGGQPDLVKTECSLPNELTNGDNVTCSETFIPPQAQ